ncbi:CD209 antigen-like [Sardina pilchardus]|uniref:CD209 antigen-like n=1 Tax=Sardina pilchardus TaxID=27697 RepID=UPI002E1406BF
METPDTDGGYIPMQSVHSFRLEDKDENIYENPSRYQKLSWISKVTQVGKQAWGHILCLGLPCAVLLVVVLVLAKNNMQRDQLQQNYINMTRERETLQKKLYQLDRLKHDLTGEKTKLERRLSDLDNIQRNLTEEKKRLQSNISELDQRNRILAEQEEDVQRRLSQMMIREHNLTHINGKYEEKLFGMGWHYFEPTWYYLSKQKRNWSDSRQDCKNRGADLVVINSREEQLFIAGLAMQAWIGLSDRDTEGVWTWVDNTNLTETYWAIDQPNNYKGQDCVVIWDRTNRLETWNDEKCDRKLLWICEM